MFDACISHVICANEKVFYQGTLLENKRKLVLLLKNSYSTFSIKSAKMYGTQLHNKHVLDGIWRAKTDQAQPLASNCSLSS